MEEEARNLVRRAICELEQDNPDDDETVCINIDRLLDVIDNVLHSYEDFASKVNPN